MFTVPPVIANAYGLPPGDSDVMHRGPLAERWATGGKCPDCGWWTLPGVVPWCSSCDAVDWASRGADA